MKELGWFKFSYLKALCQRPRIQRAGAPGRVTSPHLLCVAGFPYLMALKDSRRVTRGNGGGKLAELSYLPTTLGHLRSEVTAAEGGVETGAHILACVLLEGAGTMQRYCGPCLLLSLE